MDNASSDPAGLRILAIDVGGSGLKASVLNAEGELLTERLRIKTPQPCTPEIFMNALGQLVEPLRQSHPFNRVSVGFPGVVRRGVLRTAANLGESLEGFNLAEALEQRFGQPTRVINDADMQGLAVVRGHGVELVITLGTGLGSALFSEGQLGPHLELAHHPFRRGETYEEQVGDAALKEIGPTKWNRRVRRAIRQLRALTSFDHLYIGGGNAKLVDPLPDNDISIVDNTNGIRGGAWLWRQNAQPG